MFRHVVHTPQASRYRMYERKQ